jgi:hypothetical protein
LKRERATYGSSGNQRGSADQRPADPGLRRASTSTVYAWTRFWTPLRDLWTSPSPTIRPPLKHRRSRQRALPGAALNAGLCERGPSHPASCPPAAARVTNLMGAGPQTG